MNVNMHRWLPMQRWRPGRVKCWMSGDGSRLAEIRSKVHHDLSSKCTASSSRRHCEEEDYLESVVLEGLLVQG